MGMPVEVFHLLLQAHLASRLDILLCFDGHPRYAIIQASPTKNNGSGQDNKVSKTPHRDMCITGDILRTLAHPIEDVLYTILQIVFKCQTNFDLYSEPLVDMGPREYCNSKCSIHLLAVQKAARQVHLL